MHAALANPKTPLESRLRRCGAYFAPGADKTVLYPRAKTDHAIALMRGLTFEEAQELVQNSHNEPLLIAFLTRPELTYQEALELTHKVKGDRITAFTVLSERLDAPADAFDIIAKEMHDKLAELFLPDLDNCLRRADRGVTHIEDGLASLAEGPFTPTDVLEQMSHTKSERILAGLAQNPGTPAHVLKQLAAGDSVSAAARVAQNPNAPLDALAALLTRPLSRHTRTIPTVAARHPKITWRVRTEEGPYGPRKAFYPLSSADRTPLQGDGGEALVFYSDLPQHTRAIYGILQNPNMKGKAVEAAYNDAQADLKALEKLASSEHTLPSVHERLLKHGRKAIRAAAVKSPHTTPAQLREAANDPTADVRTSVTEHHMTPDDVLYALRSDPDPKVSRAATEAARTWSYRGRLPLP